MSQPLPRRWLVLGGALLATLVATVWPRGEERTLPGVVEAPARATPGDRRAEQAAAVPEQLPPLGEKLERPQSTREVVDLFAATSLAPPPAAAPAAAAPAAPPFPYAIAGSVADNDVRTAVFSKDNQNFILRTGEILENTYRVDAITSASITVTYIPLGLQQILPMGALQ